jgi:hypothetical protein
MLGLQRIFEANEPPRATYPAEKEKTFELNGVLSNRRAPVLHPGTMRGVGTVCPHNPPQKKCRDYGDFELLGRLSVPL